MEEQTELIVKLLAVAKAARAVQNIPDEIIRNCSIAVYLEQQHLRLHEALQELEGVQRKYGERAI